MKISVGPEAPPKRAIHIRFVPKDARGKITPAVAETEFSGKANALFYARQERVLYVGVGARAKMEKFRAKPVISYRAPTLYSFSESI